jgi:ankyrin repeat protein
VRELLAETPNLATMLSADERERLVQAAEGNRTDVTRRLLAAGWPVNDRGSLGATALHWAAWHGNRQMVDDLLAHGADVNAKDMSYDGTPLGWAEHGSSNSWHRSSGDYAGTLASLRKHVE